jgi:subtilisin family serine protease
MFRKISFLILFFCLIYNCKNTAIAASNNYSLQNNMIGATASVMSEGKNGAGITFGVIDTGVAAPWVGFQNSVDTAKSTCIISGCSKTLAIKDDNGHGTFIASQLVGNVPSIGMSGIATAGKILSVKVLNAQGAGYGSDLSNGIIYAANNGAQIINLSVGPSGTAAQQVAFYQSIASAVNYAASKNMVIVFAGGNSSQALAGGSNITGFTDAALARTLFVGSTNANQALSSFSNTAGAGAFISTTNKKVNFNSMWLMANGENVFGASNYNTPTTGYSYITQMSGTSMAAPQIAGAAGLLAARWNFLLAKGTIPEILKKTAQDLGIKGVDNSFGAGFLKIDAAMQPIGTLTVPINGKNVAVANSQIVPSSSLGNLSKVSSALKISTAYDDYQRDFNVNTPTVTSPASGSTTTATKQVTTTTTSSTRKFTNFTDGTSFSYSGISSFANTNDGLKTDEDFKASFSEGIDPIRQQTKEWSVSFSQKGSYFGIGKGKVASLLFNDARWGNDSVFFNSDASIRTSLLGVVDRADFSTFGIDLNKDSKLAFGMISANNDANDLGFSNLNKNVVKGGSFAYTTNAFGDSKISISSSFLNEKNSLLGSVSGGVVGFSDSVSSVSFGLGSEINLGNDYNLGLDLNYATTNPTTNPDSFITSTSRLQSQSMSLAFTKQNFDKTGDKLGFSILKPMRVFSGSANLTLPVGVDDVGNPIIQNQVVSLIPDGNETNLNLTYSRPVNEKLNTSFNLSYRDDADNIAGKTDAAAIFRVKYDFYSN